MDAKIVRAYDIRGVFGTDLTLQDAFAIGYAFGKYLEQFAMRQEVLLGYDGRISSPELHDMLIAGLQAGGLSVCSLGLISTPALYYAANHQLPKKSAIMVTASHNPPEYNGFKLVIDGLSITQKQLQQIIALVPKEDVGLKKHNIAANCNIVPCYVEKLHKLIPNNLNSKVIWDAGNGTAAIILQRLLPLLTGEHILLNHNIEGTFAARPSDPTVHSNLKQLVATIQESNADIGFAFDGDADRIVVVNSEGNILQGDQLLAIYAVDFLQRQPNAKIIVDVKTSQTVIDYLTNLGAEVILCKCGHAFIKAQMRKTGAMLAGEMSGHMFFAEDYYGFDDAIYAACLLLRIIHAVDAKQILQTALQLGAGRFITPEIRIACSEEQKFALIENIAKQLHIRNIKFNAVDGVRVHDEHGWWLLRASNTEPCIIARFDSNNEDGLSKQIALAEELLNIKIIIPQIYAH